MASAKLQGITMAPEEPQVVPTFLEVLDYKPAFQVVALFSPVGLLDEPDDAGRTCDRQARALLGSPSRRCGALRPRSRRPRMRFVQGGERSATVARLSAIGWSMLKRTAEVHEQMAPYWQRTIFEVHPELSFFQLNEDKPVRFSKHTQSRAGRATGFARRAYARRGTDHQREGSRGQGRPSPRCGRLSVDGAADHCPRRRPPPRAPRMGQRRSADGVRPVTLSARWSTGISGRHGHG